MSDDVFEDGQTDTDDAVSEDLPMRRKKDFVTFVASDTGLSKSDVRLALDSAFGYARQALLDGDELHYPTLGKVKIKIPPREGAKPNYRIVPAKSLPVQNPLDADGEDV